MAPVIGPQGKCITFDNPVYKILEMVLRPFYEIRKLIKYRILVTKTQYVHGRSQ